MDKFSFLGATNTGLIEDMYRDFLQDPKRVNEEWRNFFQGFDFAKELYNEDDTSTLPVEETCAENTKADDFNDFLNKIKYETYSK